MLGSVRGWMGRYTLTGCHDRTFPLGGLLLFWRCAGAWCDAGLASEGREGWPRTLTPNLTPRGIRAFRVTDWRLRATRPQSCGARFANPARSGDLPGPAGSRGNRQLLWRRSLPAGPHRQTRRIKLTLRLWLDDQGGCPGGHWQGRKTGAGLRACWVQVGIRQPTCGETGGARFAIATRSGDLDCGWWLERDWRANLRRRLCRGHRSRAARRQRGWDSLLTQAGWLEGGPDWKGIPGTVS